MPWAYPATIVRASDLTPGQRIYDNRHPEWLHRWPEVTKVEPISGGRLAVTTMGRFYVFHPEEPVLVRS